AFALRRFFPPGPVPAARADERQDTAPAARVDEEHDTATVARPDAPSVPHPNAASAALPDDARAAYPLWVSLLAMAAIAAMIPVSIVWGRAMSPWIVPGLMLAFLLFGALRGVRVYEVFVDGAREGFQVALRIIPYLVAILVAVGMLRASGAMDAITGAIGGVTGRFGLPAEALPMALLRPLSGSGAYGIMVSIIENPATGPDTYVGYLVSTLQGSSETTFYVLAVYFGAVQVRRVRHTLAAALIADAVAVIAAVAICSYLFG
ncbi:MAG TPA: nucleoside recognition domain-containing protein, partial [Roseomonas sp.]|nr:nucleoside recognition domain-containing protein [Roseomonas sp.]